MCILCLLLPLSVTASPAEVSCQLEYTTRAVDRLSDLAETYLGAAELYPAILVATQLKHTTDATFAALIDPQQPEAGLKLCIPTRDQAPQLKHAVLDASGRLVLFADTPKRVVIAGKASFLVADAAYTFPQAGRLIACITQGGQAATEFLKLVDPAFSDKMALEGDAGPEQIAAAHPDAVILKSYMAAKLGAPLEQLNIPVVYVDLETPEQYLRDLEVLGQLLGDPVRAAAVRAFYRTRLERVTDISQMVPEAQKPRVLLLQYSLQGGHVALNVPPASWIQTRMVELAGGNPVWKDGVQGSGWSIVNLEQIAAWDADVIVLVAYSDDPIQVVSRLKADAQWQQLAAVRNGRLYAFVKDFVSWDQPDTRWILGLTWLAGKLHPDRFTSVDIKQEAVAFYHQLYGIDPAIVQQVILPMLQGDVE
jgi:iron complex transport system substrate-binding protein